MFRNSVNIIVIIITVLIITKLVNPVRDDINQMIYKSFSVTYDLDLT